MLGHGEWLLAGTFTLAAEVEVLLRVPGPSWRQAITAATGLSLVIVRWRSRPLLAMAGLVAAVAVSAAAGGDMEMAVPICAVFVISYSFGIYGTWRQTVAGAVLMSAAVVVSNPHEPPSGHPLGSSILFFTLIGFGAPALIGRLVRGRSELVGRLQDQTRRLHVERQARAALATAADRLETTCELHRTVSRCVEDLLAKIAVAERDPGRNGLEAAVTIEEIARRALGEMRRLLALLSRDGVTPLSNGLPPGLLHPGGSGPPTAAKSQEELEERLPSSAVLSEVASRVPWWPVLAVLFFAALAWSIVVAADRRGPVFLNLFTAVAVAAPVSWAGRRPLTAATASLLAATLMSLVLTPVGLLFPSLLLLVGLPFAVAVNGGWKRALLGLAACTVGFVAFYAISRPSPFGPPEGLEAAVIVLGAWGAGRVVWDRSQLAGALRETNRELVREQDARAREAVIAERARIARELHDVIGHSLTVIVLQAGAARRAWDSDRSQALDALSTAARVARASLTELVASLDALDPGSPAGAEVTYLRDVEPLVDRASLAGLTVDIYVEGMPTPLPALVEVAAYRVLQEALTNVVKHSPGARTRIALRYRPRQLELEVDNSTPVIACETRRLGSGGGTGLAGMRARVAGCGGLTEWGPSDGGFAVRAQLPLQV